MRCWEWGAGKGWPSEAKALRTTEDAQVIAAGTLVAPNRWGEPRVLSSHRHAFFQDRVAFRTERVRSERAC